MNTFVAAIPSALVPKAYRFDPEVEVQVLGKNLKPGMVIILADPYYRGDPHGDETAMNSPKHIQLSCRWFRIINIVPSTSNFTDLVGRFADGSEIKQGTHAESAWYVKKDSIR